MNDEQKWEEFKNRRISVLGAILEAVGFTVLAALWIGLFLLAEW